MPVSPLYPPHLFSLYSLFIAEKGAMAAGSCSSPLLVGYFWRVFWSAFLFALVTSLEQLTFSSYTG